MDKPKLIVITDWAIPALTQTLALLRPLGPRVAIQHRAPGMDAREYLEKGRALAELGLPLFINGRVEVAIALGAHLHLPDDGRLASDVRALLPPGALISAAVHLPAAPTPAAFDFAQGERFRAVDIGLVSPVFPPGSKPSDTRPPLGPSGFARLAAALPCPAYALGGVTPDNIGQIKGAAGAAVISSVLKAADPLAAARALLAALESGT